MPVKVIGSNLEIMVYDWLVKHGFREGIDFEFQSQLIGGAARMLGDAIADFQLFKEMIILRVQGEYWHSSTNEMARDSIQKERLTGMGYTVVDIWEQDLVDRLNETMQNAIEGTEIGS